jgi:hypothetical protein
MMKDLGKIFTTCNIFVEFKAARYLLYKRFCHFQFCGDDDPRELGMSGLTWR